MGRNQNAESNMKLLSSMSNFNLLLCTYVCACGSTMLMVNSQKQLLNGLFIYKKNLLFSIVGSYESTNWPSTNCILSEDLPKNAGETQLLRCIKVMFVMLLYVLSKYYAIALQATITATTLTHPKTVHRHNTGRAISQHGSL